MTTKFEWDQAKASTNADKHGVSFDEAQTVFLDDFAIIQPDPDHSIREERWLIMGISSYRRLLVVSFTERRNRIRIISARKATRTERKQYEEKDFS